jgi:hypothetical protein
MTSSKLGLAAWVLCLGLLGGCSDSEYDRQELPLDGPIAGQIRQMLAELRRAGIQQIDGYIEAHGASDLTDMQRRALAAMLKPLADREVRLIALNRFGGEVIRVGIKPTQSDSSPVWALLVETDAGLRWAGPNQ